MKLNVLLPVLLLSVIVAACGSETKNADSGSFCKDSACMASPLRFDSPTPGKPLVTVSFKDCKIDTIHWEKGGMGIIKDIYFKDFIPNEVRPSKSYFSCDIVEGKVAWLRFNDCPTGRGYIIKLPFDKNQSIAKYNSAINNFDPKFKVADGLISYYDNTFIYVQDMATGKEAKTLLTDTGVKGIDFNDVHSLIDTVNITSDHIYARLTVDGKKVEHNIPLTFK